MEQDKDEGIEDEHGEERDVGESSVSNSIEVSDFSAQSQWAMVPQSTLITFQTLPFNLEQSLVDSTDVISDIGQPPNIGSIDEVSGKLHQSLEANTVFSSTPDHIQVDSSQIHTHHTSSRTVQLDVAQVHAHHSSTTNPVVDASQIQAHHAEGHQHTDIQEDFTPELFTRISATLSSRLLEAVPGSHAVLMEVVQSQVGTHLQMDGNKEYTISGSIHTLLQVHNKLSDIWPFPNKTRLELITEDGVKEERRKGEKEGRARTETRGTNCHLLVPLMSGRGRELHQPARYSGCVQLDDLDQDELLPSPFCAPETVHTQRTVRRTGKHRQRKMLTPRKSQQGVEPNIIKSEEDLIELNGDKQRGNYKRNYELRTPYRYFCKMCSFKTKRESHLSKHMILHEKNMRLYPCSQCNFVAIRYSVMRRHEITHSGHKHMCDKCSYKADNSKLLLRHKRIKHASQSELTSSQFKCPHCNYRSRQEVLYKRHLQVHQLPAPQIEETNPLLDPHFSYQCCDCPYKTQRKEHYLRHRANVHGTSRPYLCDLCGVAFKRPDTLAQHKLTHKDRKDRNFAFHCQQCGKGFRSQAHLTEHSTMHSTERPYLCDHCGASFKTQNVQKKHIQTIHLNPRSYSCDKCSKSFNTKYALRRHVRTHDSADVQSVGGMEALVTGEHLPTVDVSEETDLVQDVMTASIEEPYEQSSEGLRQAYSVMPASETTTALLYLTGNLQL